MDACYYPKARLILRPDVSGASFWSVSLAKTMLTYFEVAPQTRFERHRHDSEQITMVLEGELVFELDQGSIRVGKGEVVAVPSNVPHAVCAGSDGAKAVDCWSPVPMKYAGMADDSLDE